MAGMRSYGDPCGIARALDLLGERWALLVVRELMLGPKRFTDLRAGLPGASPNVLSQRLRELEEAGVVLHRSAGAAPYELSEWGYALRPILLQLGRWGARSATPPRGALGVDALMLALESTFDPARAEGMRATFELRLGDERYVVAIDRGAIEIARGGPRRCDVILETDAATLRATVFGDRALEGAPIAMTGDPRLAKAFFRLFLRPTREPGRAPRRARNKGGREAR